MPAKRFKQLPLHRREHKTPNVKLRVEILTAWPTSGEECRSHGCMMISSVSTLL